MLEVGSAARHVNACCLPYHKGDSSAAAWLCGAQTGVRGPPGGPEEAKLGVVSECNRLQVAAESGVETMVQKISVSSLKMEKCCRPIGCL